MSVLLLGEVAEGGLAGSLGRAFSELGWHVRPLVWGPWRPSGLASIALRAPAAGAPFRVRLRRTIDEQAAESVDLVLVVKGALLNWRVIDYVRRRMGAPVVCWNPDSPFDPATSNRGGGIAQAVGAYDGYVTWAEDVAEELHRYNNRVAVIPFGWDPHLHFREAGEGSAERRVVFVGTWTADRQRWIQQLAPWQPVVFGNQWPAMPGIEIRPAIAGRSLRQAIGGAHWNLNFLRPQNAMSHNMRTFEIPACGGPQLAQHSRDHDRYLAGTPSVLFRTADELASLVAEDPPKTVTQRDWLANNRYSARVAAMLAIFKLAEVLPK